MITKPNNCCLFRLVIGTWTKMTLILTKSHLRNLLSMKEVIEVVEQAFLELAKNTATMPLRMAINFPKDNGCARQPNENAQFCNSQGKDLATTK